MKKISISKQDREQFNKSVNGNSKYFWMKMGMAIDVLGTVGISVLIIYSNYLRTPIVFYVLLYALLVFIVLGAELIGTYYGSLEQYVLNKKEKKEIAYLD